jgi:hypothetical protein
MAALLCRVSDAQEELSVARARGELSRLMRQNDALEQEPHKNGPAPQH